MKPSATSCLGGVEQLDRVRVEGAVVADHLELDPLGLEGLAGELGGADRVAGGVAAGGVGQDEEAEAVDHVEDRALGGGVDAAQGDGDDLGPGGDAAPPPSAPASGSRRCRRSAARTTRARPTPRFRRRPGSRREPRPLCPSRSEVVSHSPRGTTSPSSATATPRASLSAPASRTASASVAASDSSRGSPFSSILIAEPPRSLRGLRRCGEGGAARGEFGGATAVIPLKRRPGSRQSLGPPAARAGCRFGSGP